ncbi:MAG: hypothetical protein LAN37_13680 [Acidobacteriia bacterium]|nr:hypothetical protein [Terriglobia bacterium]
MDREFITGLADTMMAVRAPRQQILGALLIALLILVLVVVRYGRFLHWSPR